MNDVTTPQCAEDHFSNRTFIENGLNIVIWGLLIIITGILFMLMISSIHWRMIHDTPLFHYAAFLMDSQHAAPYRDIFETCMPGTFLFHYILIKTLGYSEIAFHIVNVCLLVILLLVTFISMSPFGWITAWASSAIWGVSYLIAGPAMTLQRDYIGIIPIAMSLLCFRNVSVLNRSFRSFLIGCFWGIAFLIKPHLVLGLPLVMGSFVQIDYSRDGQRSMEFKKMLMCCAGFMIPIGLTVIWLYKIAALRPFLDIFLNYLPLYSGISGNHRILSGFDRFFYLYNGFIGFGGLRGWFPAAFLGIYMLLRNKLLHRQSRVYVRMIFGLVLIYGFYPLPAGKFWPYHYMPLHYFLVLASCLCLTSSHATHRLQHPSLEKLNIKTVTDPSVKRIRTPTSDVRIIPLFVFILTLLMSVNFFRSYELIRWNHSSSSMIYPGNNPKIHHTAQWLRENVSKNDTVQPLDWTSGLIHSMLLSQTHLATRFMYDYHFYHHISNPYILHLRGEFLKQLQDAEPRFILFDSESWPRVSGENTTMDWPELKEHLDRFYSLIETTPFQVLVFERKNQTN